MPEVIRCPQCERQLRVPDDLVGKKVKCPSCGATFTAAAAGGAAEPLDAVLAPGEAAAEGPAPVRPPRPPEEEYEEEPLEQDESRELARRGRISRAQALGSVKPPAICLLVAAFLGLLGDAFFLFRAATLDEQTFLQQPSLQGDVQTREMAKSIVKIFVGRVAIILHSVFFAVNALVILASIMMLLGKWRWLGITGSLLAMINIDVCCCLLGIPFGIWSLVVLLRPEVASAFR